MERREEGIQGFLKLTKSCSHFYQILPNTADIKAGFIYISWLLSPGTSSQCERHSS